MAANCSNVAAGSSGEEICGLLDGVGQGVGALLSALGSPLAVFILVLGVAAGVGLMITAIAGKVRSGTAGSTKTGTRRRRRGRR
jgi:hypothetical protein